MKNRRTVKKCAGFPLDRQNTAFFDVFCPPQDSIKNFDDLHGICLFDL